MKNKNTKFHAFFKNVIVLIFLLNYVFSISAIEVKVKKAGRLKKVLLKEKIDRIDSLTIIGEINGTDILTLKKYEIEYLDLRRCHIIKGGKVYFKNKHEKKKTENNVLSSYIFDNDFRSLKSLVLPETVTTIENNFYTCKLESIFVTNANIKIENRSDFQKLHVILDSEDMLSYFGFLSDIGILRGKISREKTKFSNNIKHIVLYPDVTTIEDSTFWKCNLLSSVEIRGCIDRIGNNVFQECRSLRDIQIPYGVKSIGNYCFKGCISLSNLNIPETVSEIGISAFEGCESLVRLDIPNGIKRIEKSCFKDCASLQNLNIPETVSEISISAFEGCESLVRLDIPNGIKRIEKSCFKDCTSLQDLYIPETVSEIGISAFEACKSLSDILFPKRLLVIKDQAFYNTELTDVKLPNSLIKLGNNVWNGCPLKTIRYPENIKDIGENNFSSMSDLSIFMDSDERPEGFIIPGRYTTMYIPDGSLESYKEWLDDLYIVDTKNPVVRTIDLNNNFNRKSLRYADTLKVQGSFNVYQLESVLEEMRMVKCLDLSAAKYVISQSEIESARKQFLQEEERKKDSKEGSELIGLIASGVSLYADFCMDPLTGMITKFFANEVKKSMDEDVKENKPKVFWEDTVKNKFILKPEILQIKNLQSIYLPVGIDHLVVHDVNGENRISLHFLELPLESVDIKDSNVQLIIPENYKSYILNSSEWDDQINKIIYKYEE
ncbi:MAG: leucine-rich repeat domain-containing protein [Parabacteroides sp.]|nr:leucine-rich repeat domain-containing protein [Parabacteroides sp.]